MKTTIQKAREQGLLLARPTSASQLRKENPELARRWAKFIVENKAQLVAEISGKICAS